MDDHGGQPFILPAASRSPYLWCRKALRCATRALLRYINLVLTSSLSMMNQRTRAVSVVPQVPSLGDSAQRACQQGLLLVRLAM